MGRERNISVGKLQRHGNRWRFVVRRGAGQAAGDRQVYSYASEQEGKAKREAVARQIREEQRAAQALTWRQAIDEFCTYLQEERGCGERSVDTARGRLRRFFAGLDEPARLSLGEGDELYKVLRKRKVRSGEPISVQEHRLCLRVAKQLGKWMVSEKHWRDNPLLQVEPIGKPKRGEESKPQLSRDELRTLVSKALDLGERGDAGAAATLCCGLLGLRASTVVDRLRRHLDDGGRTLTARAKGRTVDLSLVGQDGEQERIMQRLRRVLQLQARGKLPEAPLIGAGHDRWWVRRAVQRLCEEAGVRVVPPHGLRGTVTSVGRQLQIAPALLAGALGHSEAVQERHYATPAAQAAGQVGGVLIALTGPAGRSRNDPGTGGEAG